MDPEKHIVSVQSGSKAPKRKFVFGKRDGVKGGGKTADGRKSPLGAKDADEKEVSKLESSFGRLTVGAVGLDVDKKAPIVRRTGRVPFLRVSVASTELLYEDRWEEAANKVVPDRNLLLELVEEKEHWRAVFWHYCPGLGAGWGVDRREMVLEALRGLKVGESGFCKRVLDAGSGEGEEWRVLSDWSALMVCLCWRKRAGKRGPRGVMWDRERGGYFGSEVKLSEVGGKVFGVKGSKVMQVLDMNDIARLIGSFAIGSDVIRAAEIVCLRNRALERTPLPRLWINTDSVITGMGSLGDPTKVGMTASFDRLERSMMWWLAYGNEVDLLDQNLKREYRLSQKTGLMVELGEIVDRMELVFAAVIGNALNTLEYLVELEAKVNIVKSGYSPLHVARSPDIVRTLLHYEAKPEVANLNKITPLMMAASRGDLEIVQMLMDAGADVECRDMDGRTVLSYACICGSFECVEKILAVGNGRVKIGDGDLLRAVRSRNDQLALLLVEHGANCEVADEFGRSVLHLACRYGMFQVVQSLVARRCPLKGDELSISCANGHEQCVRALIDAGADVNQPWEDGKYPLELALDAKSGECISALVEAGANVEVEIHEKTSTAIFVAFASNHEPCCLPILRSDTFNPLKTDSNQNTALHLATIHNMPSCLRLLLAKPSIPIDALNCDGYSALMLACKSSNFECTSLLLQARANIHLADPSGNTALLLASFAGNHECVHALLIAGADVNAENDSKTTALLLSRSTECSRLLLQAGANPNSTNIHGLTPLLSAAKHSDPATLHTLLSRGADPNQIGKDNVTPLIAAAIAGADECLKILIEHRAEVNTIDNTGASALLHAARLGHSSTVRLLLQHKADPSAIQKDGNSAITLTFTHEGTHVRDIIRKAREL